MKKSVFKKICLLSLILLMVGTLTCSYAVESVDINRPCIVIHPGEYPGKLGKRSYFADKIPNLDRDKYPLENGNELGEYYLNKQYCKHIAEHIRKKDSRIVVIEFDSKNRSTDLNAAGRTSTDGTVSSSLQASSRIAGVIGRSIPDSAGAFH